MRVCLFSLIASLLSSSSPPSTSNASVRDLWESPGLVQSNKSPRGARDAVVASLAAALLKDGKLVIVRLHQPNRIKVTGSHCGLINGLGVVVGKPLKAHCEPSLWRIWTKTRHTRQEHVAAKWPQEWGEWNATPLQAELSNITLRRCQSGSDEFQSFTGLCVFTFFCFLQKTASVSWSNKL